MNRFLRIVFLCGAVLVLAVVVLYLEENWRARRVWEECRGELEAQGEKLDGKSFIPLAVPDEQNFAMAPLLAPLNDYVIDAKTGQEVPRDPFAVERLKSITLTKLGSSSPAMPLLNGLQVGKLARLDQWSRWIQGNAAGTEPIDSARAAEEILAAVQKFAPELDEFSHAAQRSFARFPLQYEKGFTMSVRHSQVLLGFSGVFCLRAMAELGTGDTAAALRDAATIDRMQAALRLEPLLISHLVRLTVLAYLAPILEQGAAQHRWNDDQLRTLQEIFGRIDLLADHERTLRGERALLNDYFERLRQTRTNLATTLLSFGIQDSRPKPNLGLLNALPQNILFYHNQAWHNRWIQELVLPVIDPSAERIYPRRQAAAEEIERQTRTTPYNFLAKLTLPIYPSMALRTAAMHVLVREAQVACALERFRLKNGQYPKSLAELVPDYLASPVQDTFSSEPLRYRLDGKDTFILYSIGWNEVDDGGVIALKPGSINRRDDQAGDWVWFGGAR